MQPLEQDMVSLAQQQICLQKMELFYDSWWVPLASGDTKLVSLVL